MLSPKPILPVCVFIFFILLSCDTTEPAPPDTGPDTTSHDFVWQIDRLGDGNGSVLYDVAIIDENNILAVGEVFLWDSVGQIDPNSYSVVVWDGADWIPKRPYDAQGQLIPALRGIFVSSMTDIWLADGGVHLWDGMSVQVSQTFGRIDLIGGSENGQSVDHLWGASSTDLYGVGRRGMIAHFDGMNWQKIVSGTTLPINDVFGSGGSTICIASDRYLNQGKMLLSIDGSSTTALADSGLSWSLSSVWFNPQKRYYVVGAGIHTKQDAFSGSEMWSVFPSGQVTNFYSYKARGSSWNDIVVVGAFGEIVHFNGISWRSYHPATHLDSGNLYSVSIKGNTAAAVGEAGGRAIAMIGRR